MAGMVSIIYYHRCDLNKFWNAGIYVFFHQVNTKYLAPLFVAYDDRLREKDSLLQQSQVNFTMKTDSDALNPEICPLSSQEDLEHFRQQIDSVIKENQRLHIRLEQTDVSGPLGMTEWCVCLIWSQLGMEHSIKAVLLAGDLFKSSVS